MRSKGIAISILREGENETTRRGFLILVLLTVSTVVLTPAIPDAARAQAPMPHAPIYILRDNFTFANGVVSGSGLPQDPYVISGWNITTTGGPSPASAIHIASARAAFVIRDILVHTPSSPSDTYGVYIENSPRGVIDHLQITGPKYGVYMSASPSSLIENNNVWNATWGIYLSGSDNSVASNNIIHNATADGITVSGNNLLTIKGNAVSCVGNCTGFFITATNSLFEGNSAANGPSCLGAKLPLCYGYRIVSTTDSTFRNNTILNNAFGFIINGYDYRNMVKGNHAVGNQYGIGLEGGPGSVNTDNTVSENNVTNNIHGIYTFMSSQNRIFDNYLRNNSSGNAYETPDANFRNLWNITKTLGTNILGGPFLGGNYYSDYTGTDGDGDGLGDTPHTFIGNVDQLPLVAPQPSAVHDIAVTGVNVQPSTSNSGSNFTITVNLFNDGSTSENFTVYTDYNQTLIEATPVTSMAAQTQTITTFTWATVGVTAGNYNITARVPPLTGEIVTKNNNSSTTLSLTPDKPPTAVFTPNMLAVPIHTPVPFDASSSQDPDGKIITYTWNFGDNSGTATGVMQVHAFSLAGNYTVTLTVRDNSGSLATTTGVVSVSALKPTAPQNLQLKSAQGVITLTWALPSDSGGVPIVEYKVYRGIDPSSLVFYRIVTGSATSFNDTSVSEGQAYYYQVTAVNSVGESPVSNRVSWPSNTQPQSQFGLLLIASIAGIILVVAAALILLLRNRSKKVPASTG